MPSRAKSLANAALKPSPTPTINAVLYFMVSMNILRYCQPDSAGRIKLGRTRDRFAILKNKRS
jgi:hypothetical protein